MEFQNRIVGSGEVKLSEVLFNPRNWRLHPLTQQNALKGVLSQVGWVQEVIINQRTGNLVDGHLRCQLAAREGAESIPAKFIDVSEEEEALILATIDPVGAMAVTDKVKLDELMDGLQNEDAYVDEMLTNLRKNEMSFEPDYEPKVDPQIGVIKHTSEEVEKVKDQMGDRFKEKDFVEVTCPHCGQDFFINKAEVK